MATCDRFGQICLIFKCYANVCFRDTTGVRALKILAFHAGNRKSSEKFHGYIPKTNPQKSTSM
jgi:hypothetical protein